MHKRDGSCQRIYTLKEQQIFINTLALSVFQLIYRERGERGNAIPERILGMGAAKSDLSIAGACKKRFIVIAIEASAASLALRPNAT
jgi:hypothetical protein